MKYLSLFSGIGGFDLAFTRAGMECAGMCEIDKHCQDVLRSHFSGVAIYDDVRSIGAKTHERGSVDIICGGFPCQDLSIAGKRAGLAGERSGLWFEFARVIDELEPRWMVIENVPGLLSSNKGRDFATIIRWLAKRGYGVCWRVLDAQYFGVPQRRRRVFVVASLGNGRAAEVLFESEGVPRNTPPRREEGKEIAGTIGNCIAKSHTELDGHGAYITSYNIQHNDGGEHKRKDRPNGGMYVNETDIALTVGTTDLTAVVFDRQRIDEYGTAETVDTVSARDYKSASDLVATSRTLRHGKEGGGKGYLGLENKAMTLGGQEQYLWEMSHANEAVRESGDVVPTLQSRMGTGGNQVPMVGVRRLTPLECERLQGFPDGWTDGQSDTTRYKQLGNAVAVPVVEWIARRIS